MNSKTKPEARIDSKKLVESTAIYSIAEETDSGIFTPIN